MNRRTDKSFVTYAEKLGVSYNHLYRVLTGQRSSAALILTVEQLYPELLGRKMFRSQLVADCEYYRPMYRWDAKLNRYVPKKETSK